MSGRGKGKASGKKSVSRSTKAGLQFPVGRIARYLKKGKVGGQPCRTAVYYAACPVAHIQSQALVWTVPLRRMPDQALGVF